MAAPVDMAARIGIEKLREMLSYDANIGEFRWLTRKANRTKVGDVAGHLKRSDGYLYISIDRRVYLAHRLAWLFVYGTIPNCPLDHIDRCKTNNRISNLREASPLVNARNRGVTSRSKSGILGAYQRNGKWTASIKIGKINKHLGNFQTAQAAGNAYSAAKELLRST